MFIISDTSVLIDVEKGRLTNVMFGLPWEFAVPDVLFEEELAQQHSHLLSMGLISRSMDGEQIAEAYSLRQKYIRTSVNDMLALTLAKNEGHLLLTGDQALRSVAEELRVDIHGTIWLVEQMILHEKITIETAKVSFQLMKEADRRLPWSEAEKMLKKLAEDKV